MTFIFQGTPDRFDIDDYLARYPFIYWSAPTLRSEMSIVDRAIIWRAKENAGAIAVGRIAELPTEIKNIRYPEALGDDLWRKGEDEPSDIKVGIRIDESRLTPEAEMLTRKSLMYDPLLGETAIIKHPQGTVFRLNGAESERFELLWSSHQLATSSVSPTAAEGGLKLRSHYFRERSPYLAAKKKAEFISEHGQLYCEACGLSAGESYPADYGTPFIEVHHRTPLAELKTETRTTLADLAVLCANCHRTVHADENVVKNFEALCRHFGVDVQPERS